MNHLTRDHADMLVEDMHVHSVFSDGADPVDTMIESAIDRGLERLCCVDHVRASTDWVPEFVAAVRDSAHRYRDRIDVYCGVEAKFVDTHGTLDLPASTRGVDFIVAADHQVPVGDGYIHPRAARLALERGTLVPLEVIGGLVSAMNGAMRRYPSVLIAHPFSILPKVGLTEADVPHEMLVQLARTAVRMGARIETSERWQCPDPRTLAVFMEAGVDVCCSTDAHRAEDVGRYTWTRAALRLAASESPNILTAA